MVDPHTLEHIRRQSGMMRQQGAQGDGLVVLETIMNGEFRHISRDRFVQFDLVLSSQSHDLGGRHNLGDRPGSIHRVSGRRHLIGDIGIAETLGPDDFLIIDKCDAQTLDVVFRHVLHNHGGQILPGRSVITAGDIRRHGWGTSAPGEQQYKGETQAD